MNEATRLLSALDDERLPALRAMLGAEACDMLDAAVKPHHAHVVSARPVQVTWRPGRSLAVTYDARLRRGTERRAPETIVAVTGKSMPSTATVLARGGERVAVWRMQDDPDLPGLATALNPDRARALLEQVGVAPGRLLVRVRAYRPRRRAVVELTAKNARVFVKVVPPAESAALQVRHRLMSEHLPVPVSHGWSNDAGLIVLGALPGITLRESLADARSQTPSAHVLAQVLDHIPDTGDGRRAHSPLDMAREHGELVARVLPDLQPRVDALLTAIAGADRTSSLIPVHGDFHEAQLLTARGDVTGVLDLDTTGLGERSDDWATLLGHLAAWQPSLHPRLADRVRGFGRDVLAIAEHDDTDHRSLRLRIAAAALGMATGPFRVQTPTWPQDTRARLAVAESWVQSAEAVGRKKSLIAVSSPSHARA